MMRASWYGPSEPGELVGASATASHWMDQATALWPESSERYDRGSQHCQILAGMNGPLEVQAGFGTSLKVTNAGSGMIIRSSALDPIPWGGALNLTAVPEA